jgi:hypothetical protein
MTRSPDTHEVKIEVDGRMAAVADVRGTADPAVVHSAMHVESGHLPPGTRSKLVDAVLDDPQVSQASHLSASMPAGDTELIDRLRQRAETVEIRAAGATKLVEAELHSGDR